MKNIREDFKKILSGLSYQNAGDCLSRREKLVLLGDKSVKQSMDSVLAMKSEGYEVSSQKDYLSNKSIA